MKIFGVPGWDGQWVYCQDRRGKAAGRGVLVVKGLKIFVWEVFTSASRTPVLGAAGVDFYGLVTEVKAELAQEGRGRSRLLHLVAG